LGKTLNSKRIKFISSNRIKNHIKIEKKLHPDFGILKGFRGNNGKKTKNLVWPSEKRVLTTSYNHIPAEPKAIQGLRRGME
jgi:hypothetical protein